MKPIIKKIKQFPSGSRYVDTGNGIGTDEEYKQFQKELDELEYKKGYYDAMSKVRKIISEYKCYCGVLEKGELCWKCEFKKKIKFKNDNK